MSAEQIAITDDGEELARLLALMVENPELMPVAEIEAWIADQLPRQLELPIEVAGQHLAAEVRSRRSPRRR